MSQLRRHHRTQSSQGEARPFADMRKITRQAAGVDMGAYEIVARVPDGERPGRHRPARWSPERYAVAWGRIPRPAPPRRPFGPAIRA